MPSVAESLRQTIPFRGRIAPHIGAGPRVLIVSRWPVGGIRTHLGYNVPALAEAGYRCTFVVPEDTVDSLRSTLADVDGCEFVGVAGKSVDRRLWSVVREQLRQRSFALMHAHGMSAAAHASLANVLSGVPLIVTLHEPLRRSQFRGVTGQLKRWLLGRALARAAAVVTVSDDSRANLLRFFPNLRAGQERTYTICNGIDVRPYQKRQITNLPHKGIRHQLELDDDTTLIGYLGRFMPEKGFPMLVETVARLVRHGGVRPFHVVAFGSGDYRREYQHDIERRDLADHLTLCDFVPDVAPILRQLDLVVVPSLWEASSLVSMEAMSAGVPVLGSDCPGLREVLRDTPSRTFRAGVVAELETSLRAALADLWTTEARAFAASAQERFDNRRSAARLVELYDAVMHSRRVGQVS